MTVGDIPIHVAAELVQSLKRQYVQMLQCEMVPVDSSFYFVNKFYVHAKAFASTAVVLKCKKQVARSYVHVKRDAAGDLMPAVVIAGPSYTLPADGAEVDIAAMTRHSSTALFRVYTKLLYGMQVPAKAVLEQSLPALPPLPPGVVVHAVNESDVVASVAPQLHPPPSLSVPAPVPAAVTSDGQGEAVKQEGRKRKREKRGTASCYICWRSKPCDILFPCRRADHACCRKCIARMFQMWSSTVYDGQATVRCPQCSCADGLVTTVQGQVVWLGTRYVLRKQRRKSYAEDSD